MSRTRMSLVVLGLVGATPALAQPGEPAPAPPSEGAPGEPAPAQATDPEPAPTPPRPVAAPRVVPQTPAAPATDDAFEPATGFALEVRLDSGQVLIDNNTFLPGTQAGVFLGQRGEKVTVGIGLELGRITES